MWAKNGDFDPKNGPRKLHFDKKRPETLPNKWKPHMSEL